jgi:hypothetical protein
MYEEEITQRHQVEPEVRWHPPDGTSHPTAGTQAVNGCTELFRTLPVQSVTRAVATRVLP